MPARKLKPIEDRDLYAAAVLDAFDALPEESLTHGLDDYCECLKCGRIGLVRAGAETCPACGQYGALADRTPPNA